jgi:hypothetical protein
MVVRNRQCQKGQIYRAIVYAIEEFVGGLFHDVNLHMGEFAREAGETACQEIRRDCRDCSDDELTLLYAGHLMDFGFGGGDLAQDVGGARQERLTHSCKTHGPSQAIKQLSSQFILEFAHLLGERGLGDMFLLGGASEASGFGYRAKVTKLMELHFRSPFCDWRVHS